MTHSLSLILSANGSGLTDETAAIISARVNPLQQVRGRIIPASRKFAPAALSSQLSRRLLCAVVRHGSCYLAR